MENFLYDIVNKMSPDLGGYVIVVFALGWWILRLDKRYVESQNDLVNTVKDAYFNKGRKRIGEILVESGDITEERLQEVLLEQNKSE